MFIVPLPGDKIQTAGGVSRSVLSFGNFREEPAMYVQGDSDDAQTVSLGDIVSVNGTDVKQGPGKVLVSTGRVKRKEQLPQKDDAVTVDGQRLKVKGLKLADHGKYTQGMLVTGVNSAGETITARVADITNITRADGSNFSLRTFLTTYKDYLGSAV